MQQNEMLIQPFFTTNASRIFVRMDEDHCDTTFLSLAQSNSSVVDATKNQYHPFDDFPSHIVVMDHSYSFRNIPVSKGMNSSDDDVMVCLRTFMFCFLLFYSKRHLNSI
jgi:hypothetical protein